MIPFVYKGYLNNSWSKWYQRLCWTGFPVSRFTA